jgi:hypothetical protein
LATEDEISPSAQTRKLYLPFHKHLDMEFHSWYTIHEKHSQNLYKPLSAYRWYTLGFETWHFYRKAFYHHISYELRNNRKTSKLSLHRSYPENEDTHGANKGQIDIRLA